MKAVEVLKSSFYGKNKGGGGGVYTSPVWSAVLAKIVSCLLIRATQMKQEEGWAYLRKFWIDAIYNHCAAELESRSLLSGRKSFGQPSFTFEEVVCGAGGVGSAASGKGRMGTVTAELSPELHGQDVGNAARNKIMGAFGLRLFSSLWNPVLLTVQAEVRVVMG